MAEFTVPTADRLIIGTEEATLDDKGRLLFSKKKRERIGESFTFTLGVMGCLVAYPSWAWEDICNRVMMADAISQSRDEYMRDVLGEAVDGQNFDRQGRVVLPKRLRELASLKDDVMVIGCGDRCEIWAAEEHKEYLKDRDGYQAERRDRLNRASLGMGQR